MKKLKLFISSAVITLTFLAPQKILCMDPDPVDHHTVRKIVTEHLAAHPTLLDSSKDKDIVVFLGNTGAGKSTLINYLSGKSLKVNDLDDIVLDNPNDSSAMAIGGSSVSETFLPAFVQAREFLLYDLPGFKDTRGTAKSLVNACFIKRIIENARSAKLIFVAGIDQITSDRGASFKTLLSQAKQLIPSSNKPLETFSSLVITKSQINKAKLPGFLKAKVDLTNPGFEILEFLLDGQMVEQMSRPINSIIDPQDRDNILKMISTMGQDKIANIDVGVIYDTNQQLEIKKIYDAEIDEVIEKLFSQYVDVQNLSALDIASLKDVREAVMDNFDSQAGSSLKDSSLIKLLRPLSESLYLVSWNEKKRTWPLQMDKIVGLINIEIKEKEKQTEERLRIEAEVVLRQAQERARVEQERAHRAEQELRTYRAAEIRKLQEAEAIKQAAKKREEEHVAEVNRQAEQKRRVVEKVAQVQRWPSAGNLCRKPGHEAIVNREKCDHNACRPGAHDWTERTHAWKPIVGWATYDQKTQYEKITTYYDCVNSTVLPKRPCNQCRQCAQKPSLKTCYSVKKSELSYCEATAWCPQCFPDVRF